MIEFGDGRDQIQGDRAMGFFIGLQGAMNAFFVFKTRPKECLFRELRDQFGFSCIESEVKDFQIPIRQCECVGNTKSFGHGAMSSSIA
nr:hypothetical protein [Desulfatitalea tepidiphila]